MESVETQNVCNLTQDEMDFLMEELDYMEGVEQGVQIQNEEIHLTKDEIEFLLETI